MTKQQMKNEIEKVGNQAIYTNKITKQKHVLSGVQDLAQAWKLVVWIALRNGWDEFDIKVEYTGR